MSALDTRTVVGSFLAENSGWTESEKWIIKWQFGYLGDFEEALATLLSKADDQNLMRLMLAFPMQTAGFLAWRNGDLGTRLRAAGLEI